jgi:hypothetical protein
MLARVCNSGELAERPHFSGDPGPPPTPAVGRRDCFPIIDAIELRAIDTRVRVILDIRITEKY